MHASPDRHSASSGRVFHRVSLSAFIHFFPDNRVIHFSVLALLGSIEFSLATGEKCIDTLFLRLPARFRVGKIARGYARNIGERERAKGGRASKDIPFADAGGSTP